MKVLGLVIAVCMVGCGGAPFAVSDSAGDGGVAEVGEDSLTDGSNASVERALTSQDAGPTALSYEASDGPVGEGSSFDAAIPVDSPSAPSPAESGVDEASAMAEVATVDALDSGVLDTGAMSDPPPPEASDVLEAADDATDSGSPEAEAQAPQTIGDECASIGRALCNAYLACGFTESIDCFSDFYAGCCSGAVCAELATSNASACLAAYRSPDCNGWLADGTTPPACSGVPSP